MKDSIFPKPTGIKKHGTVIPCSDFHPVHTKSPLNTGVLANLPLRAPVQARTPVRTRTKTEHQCEQCFNFVSDVDKRMGWCRCLRIHVYGPSVACPKFDDVFPF